MTFINKEAISFFPAGWAILAAKTQPIGHPDHGNVWIILCEKDDDRTIDTQYVTWSTNIKCGGVSHGNYTDDWSTAWERFVSRKIG